LNPQTEFVGSPDADVVAKKLDPRMAKAASNALELWQNVVTSVIRKSKGLKPEDTVELPDGNEGRYIAFALDNQGRLSMGKPHGRRKVRLKPHQAAKAELTQRLFGGYLASKFQEAKAVAVAAGTPDEVGQFKMEDFTKAQKWAVRKAEVLTNAPLKAAAKKARRRQQASRRICFGIVPTDRRAHTAA
jgi:hypothetical protein